MKKVSVILFSLILSNVAFASYQLTPQVIKSGKSAPLKLNYTDDVTGVVTDVTNQYTFSSTNKAAVIKLANQSYLYGMVAGDSTVTVSKNNTPDLGFPVSVTAGDPAKLAPDSGNNQFTLEGGSLQMSVKVLDGYYNPVVGVAVKYSVYSEQSTTLDQGTLSSDSSGLAGKSFLVNYGTTGKLSYVFEPVTPISGLSKITYTETVVPANNVSYKLVFSNQPPTAASAAQSFSAVVSLKDFNNNPASDTRSISLTAYKNSSCTYVAAGQLTGGDAQLSASGQVSFANLSYSADGIIYIKASSPGLVSACSSYIKVEAASTGPSKLVFIQFPNKGKVNQNLFIAPRIAVKDNLNKTVSTGIDSRGKVSIRGYSDPLCSIPVDLIGTQNVTPINGYATFSDIKTQATGHLYLKAHSDNLVPSLSSDCSSLITVTGGTDSFSFDLGQTICASTNGKLQCLGNPVSSSIDYSSSYTVGSSINIFAQNPNSPLGGSIGFKKSSTNSLLFKGINGSYSSASVDTSYDGFPDSLPLESPVVGNITQLKMHSDTGCAIIDGQVKCWGDDGNHRLGQGFGPGNNISCALVKDLRACTEASCQTNTPVSCQAVPVTLPIDKSKCSAAIPFGCLIKSDSASCARYSAGPNCFTHAGCIEQTKCFSATDIQSCTGANGGSWVLHPPHCNCSPAAPKVCKGTEQKCGGVIQAGPDPFTAAMGPFKYCSGSTTNKCSSFSTAELCDPLHSGNGNCFWDQASLSCVNQNAVFNLDTENSVIKPVVGIPTGVSEIALSADMGCSISNGNLYCWGAAGSSGLNYGATAVKITQITSPITNVTVSDQAVCALSSENKVYCWGTTNFNDVAHSNSVAPDMMYPINTSETGTIKKVVLSFNVVCMLNQAGEVWCKGNNTEGQLGSATASNFVSDWIKVNSSVIFSDLKSSLDNYTATFCASTQGKKIYCWGKNASRFTSGGVYGTWSNIFTPTEILGF